MRSIWLGLTLCAAAGCGGGDDDFDAPTCDDGEVRIEGTVAGETFEDARSGYTSYIFVNALNGEEGQLDVEFPDGDALTLRFPDLVANGDSVDARGGINYPSLGLDYHNCGDGYPGILRMDDEGDGGTFLLTDLREGFDSCAIGSDEDGEITGCFRSEPF